MSIKKSWPLIRVGFSTYYVGPATPAVDRFLRDSVKADMGNWNEWLEITAVPHVGSTGDIPDWVWEQVAETCPLIIDEENHGADCPVCGGDEQYFPGWKPVEGCAHEPEGHTVSYSGETLICDVSCRKCGTSGSFSINPEDINW